MTVLSAQSIRRLCLAAPPLIFPFVERGVQNGKSYGLSSCTYDCRIAEDLAISPGRGALASTIERFCLPNNVCGSPLDKSSFARVLVSAFNTHFDPGFRGIATIELVNLGEREVVYHRGDPVCQFKFEWLDEPTEMPYRGKYQDQEPGPQPARYEEGETSAA